MILLLIGLTFCLGFFVESLIGFAGTLIVFAILGFFIDIKELVLMAIFVATTASIFIIASDYKSFSKEVFIRSLPFCLVGNVAGSFFFVTSSSESVLFIFGWLLLFLAAKTIFFDKFKLPKHLTSLTLTIGGVSQGIFGIGGPFFAVALKDSFKNKSQMRTTLATFFVSYNVIRITQIYVHTEVDVSVFLDLWWIPAPLAISIHLGHLAHKKLSEGVFKKAVAALATFSGIEFLLKK